MARLPQNKASEMSELGLHVRHIGSANPHHSPISYDHQDDYYIFCIIDEGTGCGVIDFKEKYFEAGDFFMIHPSQVHRFVKSESVDGWVLIADTSFADAYEQCIFEKFALHASSFKINQKSRKELATITELLHDRITSADDKLARSVVRHIAKAFIGIVAEEVNRFNNERIPPGSRQTEIVLSFRQLLSENLNTNRKPSYYAERLHISSGYLNEVLNEVTGMSTAKYIKNELLLRAKRLLSDMNVSIKEVSYKLGIEDHAYFTRLFTQGTGVTPSEFRNRILD